MSAWITREWVDESTGKRRRCQTAAGTVGVKIGDQFVVEWIDPAGKRCRQKIPGCGRPAKNLADEKCQQVNAQLTLGTYESKNEKTFAEAKEKYLAVAMAGKRDASVYEVRASLEKFESMMKPGRLTSVTSLAVEQFAKARLASPIGQKAAAAAGDENSQATTGDPLPTVRASTVNKDLRNLRAFFRRMVKWGWLKIAPEVTMEREESLEKPCYTEAEFVAMYNAAEAANQPAHLTAEQRALRWRAMLVLYWETGARRGELVSLPWTRVDFDRRRLFVISADSKTGKGKWLNFGDLGLSHLQALQSAVGGSHPFDWQYDERGLNKQLKIIQKAAGIDPTRYNLAFHALRRTVGEMTYETHGAIAAQHKLGHSTLAVTEKHYARLATQKLAAAATMPTPAGLQPALRIVG